MMENRDNSRPRTILKKKQKAWNCFEEVTENLELF